jgi:hypothetical protein
MLIAIQTILLAVLVLASTNHSVLAQATVETRNAISLYTQHNYSAAASAFEPIIQKNPSPGLCYYAALSNRACAKEARARQLFQYVVQNYPKSVEASYCKQALLLGPKAAALPADNTQELPETIKKVLSPEIQALLNTSAGKQAVSEIMQQRAGDAEAIKRAEKHGLLTDDTVRIGQQSTTPHGDGQHPFTQADIARDGASGIDQSRYPNCWFEASMSALAQLPRGQNLLASLIRSQDKDSYIVRFPNDGVEYVISQKDLAENGIKDNALWASIIECAELKKFPNNQGAQGAENDQSRLEVGLGCITGCKAEIVYPAHSSVEELSSFIGAAVKSQNPIVAGTLPLAYMAGLPIIVFPTHAYTIIDFDPSKNMITLRNPHGRRARRFDLPGDQQHLNFEQLENGVFKMSIAEFQKYFHSVARSFI